MDLSLKDVLQLIPSAGITGVLVLIIYGGYKRWWVWGWQLEECRKEAEAWRELALRNSNLADRSLTIASKDK